MKAYLLISLVVMWSKGISSADAINRDVPNNRNIIIITLDGYRWQELFSGADSALLHHATYTKNGAAVKAAYWHSNAAVRRQKLMPFVWSVIASQGLLFGNREKNSRVNTKNFYALSYPGYNEIFTGAPDLFIFNNDKIKNANQNFLEHLNKIPVYKNKIAAFTSWDVFPYILAEERSAFYINSGNEDGNENKTFVSADESNPAETDHNLQGERPDMVTFLKAKDYLLKKHPKILILGLGGTDSRAHQKKYDEYLIQANRADQIIAQLWSLVQKDAFYKNNTTLIITTDHGRGNHTESWYKHGAFVAGSSQTWMMMLGNTVKPMGESVGRVQLHQTLIAGTVGHLLGIKSLSKYSIPQAYFYK